MNATSLPSRPSQPAKGQFMRARYLLLLGFVALFVIGGLFNEAFLTRDNGLAILRAAALSGIAAMGATFITLSGRFFSLALGQSAVIGGISLAVLMTNGLPLALALPATLLFAALLGAIQGGIIAMGANPIITTLGASALLAGLAGLATGGKTIRVQSEAIEWIGNARFVGVPIQTWAFVASVLAAWWIINKTRFGHETVLIGANRATARASGISVPRVTMAVFMIASVTAAIVGIFAMAQFSQARASGFEGLDFDVVAAVLIGGTAIQGGRGSPVQSALGAVLIATVQNYMLLLGWSSGTRTLITGMFILAIVVAFHVFNRRKGA